MDYFGVISEKDFSVGQNILHIIKA